MKSLHKTKKIIALSIAVSLIPMPASAWELNDVLKPKVIASILLGTTALYLIYKFLNQDNNNNGKNNKLSQIKRWPVLAQIDPSTDCDNRKNPKNPSANEQENSLGGASSPTPMAIPKKPATPTHVSPQPSSPTNPDSKEKKEAYDAHKPKTSVSAPEVLLDGIPLQSQCATCNSPTPNTESNVSMQVNTSSLDKEEVDKRKESTSEHVVSPNVALLPLLPSVQSQIVTRSNNDIPKYSSLKRPRNGIKKWKKKREQAKKHRYKPYKLRSQQQKGAHEIIG